MMKRRPNTLLPVAIIDIGSNSVRLLVYEGAHRSPTPLFNEKVNCALGRSLSSSGNLNPKNMERAYLALRRFKALSDQLGVQQMKAFATAAARDAKNGPEFIARASEICDCEIAVLSGKEEAQMAADGLIAGIDHVDGLAGDLGGGSLELMDIHAKDIRHGTTVPLGGLRLIDLSGGDFDKARQFIDKTLDEVKWLSNGAGRPFYAIGGTWRAFAKLHMSHVNYPLRVTHNYRMSPDEALDFARLIDKLSASSLSSIGIEVLSKTRRETLPYGALLLESLFQKMSPSEIVFSSYGVREGTLFTMLSQDERERDPILAGCADLSDLMSRSPEHARELCAWTDQIFTEDGPDESAEQRRLRHAACLISDIGWRVHPEYRGEQCYSLLAHASIAGLSHRDRSFLALASYFRNEGSGSSVKQLELSSLLDKAMIKRARIVGSAIRVAHMISAGMAGVIDQVPLYYEDKKLVLEVPEKLKMLDGERLQRRFRNLANYLDMDNEMRQEIDEKTPAFSSFLSLFRS